jgi:hypothetical protein
MAPGLSVCETNVTINTSTITCCAQPNGPFVQICIAWPSPPANNTAAAINHPTASRNIENMMAAAEVGKHMHG